MWGIHLKRRKTKSFEQPCDGLHQAQTALVYRPPYSILSRQKTAFILAYCINLYASADGLIRQIHTGKENIRHNLIHSGSSCNVGAAQQVVLWCLSLVSKINVLTSELNCMKNKKIKYFHPKSLTDPLFHNPSVNIVCTQTLC